MINNEKLQQDVQNAIKWEPILKDVFIGVIVNEEVVMLTGVVDSYVKKLQVENVTKKVHGVRAIVEKIIVKLPKELSKSDSEVAKSVLVTLDYNSFIPKNTITVIVEAGWVTLEGELPWNYHKEIAKNTIIYVSGVKGVTNNIIIKPTPHDKIEQEEVESAFIRSSIDSSDIKVKVSGTELILSGTVNSFYAKNEASRIAWNTPGILSVINEISIDYENSFS